MRIGYFNVQEKDRYRYECYAVCKHPKLQSHWEAMCVNQENTLYHHYGEPMYYY